MGKDDHGLTNDSLNCVISFWRDLMPTGYVNDLKFDRAIFF